MQIDHNFWENKRVFITGHTGFKGSWMTFWLKELCCKVSGYSLKPNTNPNLFEILKLENDINHNIGDIRDYENLFSKINNFKPDIVFHLAAQPLVRYSYQEPIETYSTNVMGTVNLLEAVRNYGRSQATIVITSDKCYKNKEQIWGYRESDPMGGHDPYSNSKGCSELVVSSYANSYFIPMQNTNNSIGKIASVRAGNVIGGGDWSMDRLIPDIIKGLSQGKDPVIRNPNAIRPWQHVIEPICGYIIAAQHICNLNSQDSLLNWNFGPDLKDQKNVQFISKNICDIWGSKNKLEISEAKNNLHEANLLYLDCTKAKKDLNWVPKYNINTTLKNTIGWYKAFYDGNDMIKYTINQINDY